MLSVRVPGFSPRTSGFHFANAFPPVPDRQWTLPVIGTISIGNAANGLCGGMSYAVGDLWAAHQMPPVDTSPPAGGPAFDFFVDRQIDSFADGAVPIRFYELMSPARPDREPLWAGVLGHVGVDDHSRTYVMLEEEWPRIRADLDGGSLSMLGLVRIVDFDPGMLGHNHQVVAYGYDLDGTALTLWICDPNWPDDDTVTLRLDVGDPMGNVTPLYSKSDAPVVCFFRTPYTPRDPTPWRSAGAPAHEAAPA